MRWNQKKPLWPLLCALGCLFALAVAAPRTWQRLRPAIQTSPQRVTLPLQLQVSEIFDADIPKPEDPSALRCPVLVPDLPPIEQDSYSETDFDYAEVSVPERLPARQEFQLETLLQLRDTLFGLVGRLSEVSPADSSLESSAASRVKVSSESDRLAMRDESVRGRRRQITPTEASAAAEEDFADVLLQAVRRSRGPTRAESRLALRATANATETKTPGAAELSSASPLLRFRPKVLIDRLELLAEDSPASEWAAEALALVQQLCEDTTLSVADGRAIVERLQLLAEQGNHQVQELSHNSGRQDWLRGVRSLERRLGIWQMLFDSRLQSAGTDLPDPATLETPLMPILGSLASLLADKDLVDKKHGSEWREYLLLDQIAAAASEGAAFDIKGRRKLAQEVLSRMTDQRLTEAQSDFLQTEPVVALREALRPWAMGPVDIETFAALIERYESQPDNRYAAALVQLQQRLLWSYDSRFQQLAEHLDRHYRGANMRLALTDDLLNEMMPEQTSKVAPVNTRIAGAKVRGRARTTTRVQVRLLPNEKAWQLALEANGTVTSQTRSDTWPARVRNAAKMHYHAQKKIVIDQQGLRVAPAKAQARGHNELVGIDTEFDPIPIISHLLRDVARKKHNKSRPLALSQVKNNVARQARRQMDSQANPKLVRLEQKFQSNILASIDNLALIAEPVEMFTTEERLVMKLRLANQGQLAAHTARPLAPADSFMSMQLHESALNNAVAGLGLNGRRMTMLELFDFVAEKLGRSGEAPPADLPTRAVVEFAKHDAIRVNCVDDRLEIVLNIREVSQGRDKIQNFAVHAFFRPKIDGLDVRLVRDGTLQFAGRNLRTGPRVVLHSVFGKLLTKDHEVRLLNRNLGDDPRFDELMVTQLVLEEGWIGLALGPEHPNRTAWRTTDRR